MVPSLSEVWLVFAGVSAFGVLAALYGFGKILEHELARIRLERRAKIVYEAYLRRLDAIARGEANAGDPLILPEEDLVPRRAA